MVASLESVEELCVDNAEGPCIYFSIKDFETWRDNKLHEITRGI
jgi:hypothetical protein